MNLNSILTLNLLLTALPSLAGEPIPARPQVPKEIKAYDISITLLYFDRLV